MQGTEQIKHHCISCGQNLNIYGGPASACDHGWLCEICQDSSECPSCALAEEEAGMPRCPECKVADFPRIEVYDFGCDRETGYSDSGERAICKHCGCDGDPADFAPAKRTPQQILEMRTH